MPDFRIPLADFKMPLSGNVNQTINPMTWWMSPIGSQFGLININLGKSSNPQVEEEVLNDVGSYGKQLGQMQDAMAVLIELLPKDLNSHDQKAIDTFKELLRDVAKVKARHRRA
jgi:hypothetical protein